MGKWGTEMPCNWLHKCSAAAAVAAVSTSEAGGTDYSYAHNGQCRAVEGQGEHWSPPVACIQSWHMTNRANRKVGTPF